MDLWKLGNFAYIIPSTGLVNKLRFLYPSFFPQSSPQDSNREMTEKRWLVKIIGTPCHLFMTFLYYDILHTHCHLMPSLFHLMGVALYCNFFSTFCFLLQLVFNWIKVCCLSPLSVWVRLLGPPSLNAF